MRFRSKGKARGLIQPRDQRRLVLVIVGIGGLALILMTASRPAFWSRFTGAPPRPAADVVVRNVSEDLLGTPRLEADEFTVGPAQTSGETAPLDLKSLLDRDEAARLERMSQGDLRSPGKANADRIPADLLKPVRDDIIGVHSNESDAYFASLRLAEKLAKSGASGDQAHYALLMDSPETCRGQAWTLQGTLRRMTRLQSDANSFGVKSLYDAWLTLPDSGNQLVHVVAVAADAGLPLGDTRPATAPSVRLTGYFFKREGYVRAGLDQKGDVALTPLLLAGKIERSVAPETLRSGAEELTPWLGWLALATCVGVVAIIWQFQISDSLFRRTRIHQLTTLPVRVSFDGVDAMTVSESLRVMEGRPEPADGRSV